MPILYQTLPVATTEKGEPGGVATLDVNGKIPLSQLPPAVGGDGDVLSVNSIAPDENGDVYITTSVIPEGDDLYYTRARFDAAFAEEIASTTQAISDLQNEVNTVETGAGLGVSGTYSPDLTTNYLTTASSLKDADKKLDTQTKVVADALSSEIANRSSADQAIEAEIDTLTTDLSNVSSLVQNIKAGAGLSSTGTFVVKTTSNYINSSTNIDQSTGLLDSALKAVSNRVGILEADPVSKTYVDGGLALKADATALTAETNRALGVEADLQDQIDGLVSADSTFALAAELNATQSGAGLETTGTYSPDLTTNYLTTASSLKDADKKLDTQIKTVSDSLLSEISNRANADSALAGDILAEETRALAAELSLQGQINTIEASSGLGTDGSYAPPEGSQFLGATTSLKSALAALDTNLATVYNDFNQHHLHNNSYFVNDGDSDIQTVHDLADFGQGDVIYVGSGSYGGSTLTLSKQNFAVQAPYVGLGTTICELAGGRGLTIEGATCTRVRVSNLQVEGDLTLGASEGRLLFTNCEFLSSVSISGVSNFITFTDCAFTGAITIANTVSATIYFVRCSFGGQLISSSVASPLQVILADCSGIHASQTNLVSKVALVGRTSYASGAVVQITNAANYVYDLVNGLSTTFSGAYSELRGKPTLVTASTGLSDSASLLRTSDLGTTVAPLTGGKIDIQYIPATVLTDVHVVADEAERLAIPDLVEGDYAIQTDDGSQWIYSGSAWYQVSSSGGGITTINGKGGSASITLYTDDISEDGSPTNLWHTAERARTAAVVNSTDNTETTQAPSVSATKSYVSTQLGSYLQTSSYTAADVLTKIKTVDGSGSGLDADLLDGINSDAFVQTSGAQSIAGVKTFSDAPVVPDQSASDNSTKVANTKYVDAAIAGVQNNLGASGQVVYKGNYNASTASPSLTAAKKGWMYTISANGTLAGVSLTTTDQILFAVDVSGGVVAATDFVVIDNTEAPQTGSGNLPIVSINSDNATLTTNAYNLYPTVGNWNAKIPVFANVSVGDVIYLRIRSSSSSTLVVGRSTTSYSISFFYAGSTTPNALSLTESGEYLFRCTGKNTTTNTLSFEVSVSNAKALRTTADLAELTNLYYTDARARAAFSAGSGISLVGGTISNSAPYSDSSARASLSAGTGISYNSTTGVIQNSAPFSDASARAALSAGSGISYSSATGVISANLGLANLNGVSISGPQADQVLKYNGTSWVNAAQPSIYLDEDARNAVGSALESGNASNTGITFTNNDVANTITAAVSLGGFSINALSDVDTETTAPTVNQVLSWDGTNWKPSTVSGGGSGGLLVQQSEAWTDATVDLTSPSIYADPGALPDEYYVFWRGTASGTVVLPSPTSSIVLKKIIVKNLTSQQLTIRTSAGQTDIFYESDTVQGSIVMPANYPGFSTTLICAKVASVGPGVRSYVWTVI